MKPELLKKVVNLLGKEVKNIHSVVSDEMYREMTSEIIGGRKSLSEVSFGAIPRPIGAAIQALLKVDRFIGIAYLIEGKLYGTSLLGMSKEQPDPPREILENLIYLAALSLRRKQSAKALRKSEAMFQKVFETLPIGLWIADKNGKLIQGNPAGVKIWGMEPRVAQSDYGVFKARRLPSREEIAPEDWALAHTVNKGVTIVDELLEIDAFDGKKKMILNYTAPILDINGEVEGAIVVNQDITERKQAELFSKNLVTMNPVSIQVLDKDGFTLEVNPAFKMLFGSVPPADYSIFNDHQLAKQGIIKIFDQLRNGEVVHFPDVSFNPHDSIPEMPDVLNWVRTVGFPICSTNEKPERFVLMQENITERKIAEDSLRDSELKFRQTFDISPVGIVMVGLDKRFINCNLAFSHSLGYEAEELVGKLIEEVTLPEDNQIGVAEMTAIVKGEISESKVQKRYLRKDGQVIWGEVIISLNRVLC